MFTQLYMHLVIDYKSCDRCSSFDVTSLPNNLTSRWQEGRQSSLKMRQNHMIPPSLPSHESSLYKTKKPPPSAKNNPAKIRVLRIGPKLTCHVTKRTAMWPISFPPDSLQATTFGRQKQGQSHPLLPHGTTWYDFQIPLHGWNDTTVNHTPGYDMHYVNLTSLLLCSL